jgi:tryptophan synthase alpha subunit
VGKIADGVIIGSRLVRAVSDAPDPSAAAAAAVDFLRQVRTAME